MSERVLKLVTRTCLLALVLTAVIASTAQAAPSHHFLGTLTGAETEAEEFEYSCGVAVDPAGYLYVSSYGTSRVNVFNPDHELVTEITDEGGPCDLAVDSEGNVYVRNEVGGVKLYEPDSYPPTALTTYTESTVPFPETNGNPEAIAVNQATGRFFIAIAGLTNGGIAEYKSVEEGSEFIQLLPQPAALNSVGVYGSIDVDSGNGDFYLGFSHESLVVLNPAGSVVLHKFETPSEAGEIAIDQSTGNVLVSLIKHSGVVDEFEPDGTLVSEIGPSFGNSLSFVDSGPSGLAVDNSSGANAGNVYVGSGVTDSVVYEFGPLAEAEDFPLSIGKAGSGTGTVQCKVNGGPTETCAATYAGGDTVEVVATPSGGSTFTGYSGDCSGSSCTLVMTGAKAVTATFAASTPPSVSLTIARAGTGSGSVSCNGGSCAASYPAGTEVELAATPAAGSGFAGFSGSGCSASPCKVVLNANSTVTATFNAVPTAPPPPPAPTCTVPKLSGKTLTKAKSALKAAHCSLGKVTRPKPRKGKKLGPLVVKSSSPAAGAQRAENAKVGLKLGSKPTKKGKS